MNVIIANEYKNILNNLEIETIKTMDGQFSIDEIISSLNNFFFNKLILDVTAIKDNREISNYQKLSMSIDTNKLILFLDNNLKNDSKYISQIISLGIYNFASDKDTLMYLYNNPNLYKDVAHLHNVDINLNYDINKNDLSENKNHGYILGIKNVTSNAGATTLTYLLKKELSKDKYTVAIEINKNDFGYFNEKDMYSVRELNLGMAIQKFNNANIILLDLNNNPGEKCDEIIYLIEPSIIKLNKMITQNKNIFDRLSNKKIVLNKSLLSEEDVKEFELESNFRIIYNIPPLNDRSDNTDIIKGLIEKLEI